MSRYEFRTNDGRVCCSGNDIQHLCHTCRAKVNTVPPPPSLVQAIRSEGRRRSTTSTPRFNLELYRGDRVEQVPDPPSLIAAIQRERR